MERNDEPRLAVLFDADNTAPKWAEAIFEEIATLGEASVRRIYEDFSGPHLRSWEKKLAGLAVVPHQQFAYTKGKNSSDIALVIDAMDLMHLGRFDGFVLVSSDSDFSRLASRLREPRVPYRNSCPYSRGGPPVGSTKWRATAAMSAGQSVAKATTREIDGDEKETETKLRETSHQEMQQGQRQAREGSAHRTQTRTA